MTAAPLQAPFPHFGGKSRIASEVWQRFGTVKNYVEPFFGSGAILLARPESTFPPDTAIETVNDADAMIANFWRSLRQTTQVRHQRQRQTGARLVLTALSAWSAGQVVVSCKLWK